MIESLALRAESVTVLAGERALLDGVSLTLPPGSMTVVLGPNGAGKTTLIRVLAGVLPAARGDVRLGGSRIRDLDRSAVARRCAYMPQQAGAPFEMRVEDVVMLGRFPHAGRWGQRTAADFQRVAWALERVGLAPLRRRTLPTLSGGELQRVFLARALAQEAPILLLDEPLSALDIGRQLELMALLEALNRDGHTILAALHDLRAAIEFFPRGILLNRGRLAAEGPTGTLVREAAFESAFGVRICHGGGFRLCPLDPAIATGIGQQTPGPGALKPSLNCDCRTTS